MKAKILDQVKLRHQNQSAIVGNGAKTKKQNAMSAINTKKIEHLRKSMMVNFAVHEMIKEIGTLTGV